MPRQITPPITAEQIRSLYVKSVEATEPADTILEILRQNAGKRVDERLIQKLRAATGDESIRRMPRYGSTYIQWGRYGCGNGNEGGEIKMGDGEANVFVNVQYVLDRNARYYSARDERNNQRRSAQLLSADAFQTVADAINNYHRIRSNLAALVNNDVFAVQNHDLSALIKAGEVDL